MMNRVCIVPLLSLPGRLPIQGLSSVLQRSTCNLVPRRRCACACSAWQARLGWGLHLQSDNTLALEHHQIRFAMNSPSGGPFGNWYKVPVQLHYSTTVPHPRAISALPRQHLWPRTAPIDCSFIWQRFRFRLNFSIGGISCCKSPRDLKATCCCHCYRKMDGWRLIHVRPSSIDARIRSELASLRILGLESGAGESHSSRIQNTRPIAGSQQRALRARMALDRDGCLRCTVRFGFSRKIISPLLDGRRGLDHSHAHSCSLLAFSHLRDELRTAGNYHGPTG